MALLLIEGFEQYGDLADLRKVWSTSGSGFNINTSTRHGAGRSMQITGTNNNVFRAFPDTDVLTVGFAVNFTDSVGSGHLVCSLRNTSSDHVVIWLTTGGEIQIRRNTTVLGVTSGLGLVAATWYYFELEVTIHDSAGAYDFRIDGATELSDTNVDTRNGSTTTCNTIRLNSLNTIDSKFDDVYVLDDAGSDNITFLGDCRVETVFPDALGNENDFTASPAVDQHLNVDDGSSPDDDTTYNHSATATDRELYGFAALTGNIGSVFGVEAYMHVRKEEAGFREVRVIARSNVTEVESGNLTLGIDYVYKSQVFETDPDGGVDWDEASVNAAQFGLDLQT